MPLLDSRIFAPTLVAFVVIALLAVVLRWTFSRDVRRRSPPTGPPPNPDDFGLLATVAAVDTREEADRVRALLGDAGIRATVTVGGDDRFRVLVFASELMRARRVFPSR